MGNSAGAVVDWNGTPRERLERRLERQPNGCLEWQGYRTRRGYGAIHVGGKVVGTHCLAWSLVNGPIPEGQLIRHFVCDNPPCCDETHLRLGTDADNAADKMMKGCHHGPTITHCPQRHKYTPENTGVYNGKRYCRTCNRNRCAARRARAKGTEMSIRSTPTRCPRT